MSDVYPFRPQQRLLDVRRYRWRQDNAPDAVTAVYGCYVPSVGPTRHVRWFEDMAGKPVGSGYESDRDPYPDDFVKGHIR